MMSRAHKNHLSDWWWTVDKFLLTAVLLLLCGGILLSLSASPPVAERLEVEPFHFVKRHGLFLIPAIAILIGVSFLTPRWVRRVAVVVLGISLIGMLLVPFIGTSVKGAARWIDLGFLKVQPSEFMKPAFIVISAWFFAESARQREVPSNLFGILLLLAVAALLIAQPDLGQTILVAAVWGMMFFLAGLPWRWVNMLVLGTFGLGAFFYLSFSHFHERVNRFLTGSGDTFQVDRGLSAITNGGWFGTGPGEGKVKNGLPDSHTDFIFSVAAEEFGIAATMGLVLLFAFVVLRCLMTAMRERDRFVQLAVAGLSLQFGLQAFINMGVNLRLLPAKGMTLPFISYGGSSLLAISIGVGFLLALTRKRAESYRRRPVPRVQPVQAHG